MPPLGFPREIPCGPPSRPFACRIRLVEGSRRRKSHVPSRHTMGTQNIFLGNTRRPSRGKPRNLWCLAGPRRIPFVFMYFNPSGRNSHGTTRDFPRGTPRNIIISYPVGSRGIPFDPPRMPASPTSVFLVNTMNRKRARKGIKYCITYVHQQRVKVSPTEL